MFTTTRTVALGVALLAVAALGGCEETKKALGQVKQPPDEFAVFQRAPLSLPPDYALRPPAPGTERPQSVNPRDQALAALGQNRSRQRDPSLDNLSPGERQLLTLTGADHADPSIRGIVNSETRELALDSESFTDKLVFWRKASEPGTVVDPEKESKRLRENQANGKPLNEGQTPTIQRRQKGLLER